MALAVILVFLLMGGAAFFFLGKPFRAKTARQAFAYWQKGMSHLQEWDPRGAETEFRQAVKLDSTNPRYQISLGLALAEEMTLGGCQEAENILRRSLKNPLLPEVGRNAAKLGLADALVCQGRYDVSNREQDFVNEARPMYLELTGSRDRESRNFMAAAHVRLASLFLTEKDPQKALEHALQAESLFPPEGNLQLKISNYLLAAAAQLLLEKGNDLRSTFSKIRKLVSEQQSPRQRSLVAARHGILYLMGEELLAGKAVTMKDFELFFPEGIDAIPSDIPDGKERRQEASLFQEVLELRDKGKLSEAAQKMEEFSRVLGTAKRPAPAVDAEMWGARKGLALVFDARMYQKLGNGEAARKLYEQAEQESPMIGNLVKILGYAR